MGQAGQIRCEGREPTMKQRHSSHQELAVQEQRQQADATEHEPITLETLDAERDLGPMFDSAEPSEIYLNDEDFLASLPPYEDSQ